MDLSKKKIILLYGLCFCWKYVLAISLFLFSGNILSAQDFTVFAAPTHESCPGNGKLDLSTQNAAPDIAVNYKVYLLPNTTSPIFNSTGTSVIGLSDGTYLVIATQAGNGTTLQDEMEVIIQDETIPLTFTMQSEKSVCGPDGSIQVTVTSGNAVSYETIAGPVIKPPQPSNHLEGLLPGTYSVRVTDVCGTGIVITQIVASDGSVLVISPPMFPDAALPACGQIKIGHNIAPANNQMQVHTPLLAKITVYPPDGTAPVVYNQTINSVGPGPDLLQVLPFYYNTPYSYDLEIIDACGTVYTSDNAVNEHLRIIAGAGNAGCPGKYLKISVVNFVPPYTITFTDPPAFDPVLYNALHPGPFSGAGVDYGSEEGIAVPYGSYSFSITDACGRTGSVANFLIEEDEIEPAVSPDNADCINGFGGVVIEINNFKVVQAFITEAPDEYPHAVQHDVTGYIDELFRLNMENLLPPGDYVAVVIDECGREFEKAFTIEVSSWPSITGNVRVSCSPGLGAAAINSSTTISKVIIVQAPAAFTSTVTMPHDASYNINNGGDWFMDDLPPGTYKFLVDDQCTSDFSLQKMVSAYSTVKNDLTITRRCGSFDLRLEHTSTSSISLNYALQKEIAPGQWGHPENGTPYVEGTEVNGDNSYPLVNNVNMESLPFTGNFRILKQFKTFGTGRTDDDVPDVPVCIEVLHENFKFDDQLTFDSIRNLTCSGTSADVQVFYIGAEPITYKITHKNSVPYVVDNGTNAIFEGLEPAQYTIIAQDPCGKTTPITFSVADLPSLVSASHPGDMTSCDENNDHTEPVNFSILTPLILNGQDPENCMVTYHLSEADAEAGINVLPMEYEAGSATFYARVVNNLNTACHAVTSFNNVVLPQPQLQMPDSYFICEGEPIAIYGDPGYDIYTWDGVDGGPLFVVSQAGTHTLSVRSQDGCEGTMTFTVASSSAPAIASIAIDDWSEADNTITVITEPSLSAQYYEYSLDGIAYQSSNTFTGLAPGQYTVYVRDTYDCGADEGEVYLLTYPKFFTPNGDGINDKWRIQFSGSEPDLMVYIYDRYGKVVSSFDAMHTGWDGTFNGSRLPATDYWFVVKRQDGKEYKGHFSMLR